MLRRNIYGVDIQDIGTKAGTIEEKTMLKGKTALVTGSTSGIGLGIARAMAQEGANIVLNGFGDAHEIEIIRHELANAMGVEVRYSPADMTKAGRDRGDGRRGGEGIRRDRRALQQCRHPARRADRRVSGRQVGRDHRHQPVVGVPHHPGGAAGDAEEGWGRIIQTASAHALVASPFKAAYVAAKHGIAGLTKVVALEAAQHGITVNAIAPAMCGRRWSRRQIPDTAKARGMTEEEVKRDVMLSAQPTKEFVTIEEVAALAVFLTTDAARNITGATLPIDGGWTAA